MVLLQDWILHLVLRLLLNPSTTQESLVLCFPNHVFCENIQFINI